MISKVRTWILRIFGKTVIPLVKKILIVSTTISGVLNYVLKDIIDGKLEIPEGTPIPDTIKNVLDAVNAITNALLTVLEFFGEDVKTYTHSSLSNIHELEKITEELNRFNKSLKE